MADLTPRALAGPLSDALADTPAVLVAGPRQAGKTTLCRARTAAEDRHFISFDDSTALAAASADAQGFIAALPHRVILDEVQRVPELFAALKLEIDERRQPGRFLMTGSADVLALPRISESLAGRMEVLTLWPLSQAEIQGTGSVFVTRLFKADFNPHVQPVEIRDALISRALAGGYPEALARQPARRDAWFSSYLTTILQRDVRDIASIDRLAELPRILRFLAARAARVLNLADAGRALAVPATTLARYITILETTFLIRKIPAWAGDTGRRLLKAPRVVLTDTGLLAHLDGITVESLAPDFTRAGPLLENFVAMELIKQLGSSSLRAELFHYRSYAGQEVDFVLESADGRLVGIEVKARATVNDADFAGLRSFRDAVGQRFHRGVVLYSGANSVPFGAGLSAAPISALWS